MAGACLGAAAAPRRGYPGPMNVIFGADHAGFPLKETLLRCVADAGYTVEDLGTHSTDPVDYPDFAAAVARAVAAGRAATLARPCGARHADRT